MAPLNKVTPLIEIWVGDLNVTPWVSTAFFSEPQWNYAETYARTGTLELVRTVRQLGESFELEDNLERWRPRQQPVKFFLQGALVATLRIKSYRVDRSDPDNPTSQVELEDLLAIDNDAAPPKSYGSGENVSAWEAVQAVFAESGLDAPPSFNTSRSYDLAPVKLAGPRWGHAAKISGLDRYALYLDADEKPQVAKWPAPQEVKSLPTLWSLPRSQVDEFNDIEAEPPPDRITVSGSAARSRKVQDSDRDFDFTVSTIGAIPFPPKNEVNADISGGTSNGTFNDVVETTRKFKSGDTEGTEVKQAAASLFPNIPEEAANTNLVLTNSTVTSRNYNGQGQLTQVITTNSAALGAAYPDEFPGDKRVVMLERTIENWNISAIDDWVTDHTIQKDRRLPWKASQSYVNEGGANNPGSQIGDDIWIIAASWVTMEATTETWRKSADVVGGKTSTYGHMTVRSVRRELAEAEEDHYKYGPMQSDGGDFEWVDTPPSPSTLPPDRELGDEPFSGKAEVRWIDELPYPKDLTVTEELCNGRGDAEDLAEMLLDQAWARDSGKLISMPLRASYWSPEPFAKVIIDGEVYIQEARTFTYVADATGQDSEMVCYLAKVGASGQVPD
ncbi:MAG: hypothetical protein AAF889_07940 [Cyanobacteria bacterium P01_D01_bin.73]